MTEEEFDELRRSALAIAYRMLDSVSEAEDVVLEGFLRLHRAPQGGEQIASMRAHLSSRTSRRHARSSTPPIPRSPERSSRRAPRRSTGNTRAGSAPSSSASETSTWAHSAHTGYPGTRRTSERPNGEITGAARTGPRASAASGATPAAAVVVAQAVGAKQHLLRFRPVTGARRGSRLQCRILGKGGVCSQAGWAPGARPNRDSAPTLARRLHRCPVQEC
jgi:Sigma-70 region 2